MQRMNRLIAIGLGLTAACSGGSAAPMPDGPLNAGVIAGNNQVVPAAPSAALPQQVVAQVVRLPNGTVGLRMRLLDAMLPEQAYAQTAVTGVPNQVVCARAPDPKHALTAEVLCANSDATGKAYFTFHADSVAGVSKAQVALSTSTGTKITDSVSATVLAGVVDSNYARVGNILQKGDTIPSDHVRDKYGNPLPFAIVSDSLITVYSAVAGSPDARRFTFVTPTGASKLNRVTDIRGADGTLIARMRYSLATDGTFWVSVAGLNRTP